jgi:hypothetical protein
MKRMLVYGMLPVAQSRELQPDHRRLRLVCKRLLQRLSCSKVHRSVQSSK